MPPRPSPPLKVFLSYSHKDRQACEELRAHLTPLEDNGLIKVWVDSRTPAGDDWEKPIEDNLNAAEIIILLLSPNFANSHYCKKIEMKRACERADNWEARLIPILYDHFKWEAYPQIEKRKLLPLDARPVVDWGENRNRVWKEIIDEIEKIANSLRTGGQVPRVSERSKRTTVRLNQSGEIIVRKDLELPPPVPSPFILYEGHQKCLKLTTVRLDESGKIVERKELERPLIIEDLGEVRIELVEIPGGEFWMGSTSPDAKIAYTEAQRWYKEADEKWYQAETPRHRVRLSSFAMGRYPVTQEEWMEVMGDLPEIEPKLRGDRRPVVNISWMEALEFCDLL
ncbi:MAG: TIR domain-containing protein, partial [Blastocatellia bacterium]